MPSLFIMLRRYRAVKHFVLWLITKNKTHLWEFEHYYHMKTFSN